MQLVFSDEFNTDGRTFYPGDDPYWEAEDLHYWVRFEGNHFHAYSRRYFIRLPTTWSGMIQRQLRPREGRWLSRSQRSKLMVLNMKEVLGYDHILLFRR